MRRYAYKLLNPNGRSPYRDYPYRLPDGRRFAEWMETDGPARLGTRGFHGFVSRRMHPAMRLFLMEVGGEVVSDGHELTATRVRLVRELRMRPISMKPVFRGLLRCVQCGKPHNAYKWAANLAPQWGDLEDGHPYYKEDPEALLMRLPKALLDEVLAA
jgi:hypothetical protein